MEEVLKNLLYTDNNGNLVSLEENQFSDSISHEKKVLLQAYLRSTVDLYERYQIVLLLISWGCEENLIDAEDLISNYQNVIIDEHRLHHVDLRYDRIGEALGLFYSVTDRNDLIKSLMKKLLVNFRLRYFEGRFQKAIEDIADSDLLTDIKVSFEECINSGDLFKASTLLPSIAKINPSVAMSYIENLLPFPDENYSTAEFSAIALKYIDSIQSKEILNSLLSYKNKLVRREAKESLDLLYSR